MGDNQLSGLGLKIKFSYRIILIELKNVLPILKENGLGEISFYSLSGSFDAAHLRARLHLGETQDDNHSLANPDRRCGQ